MDTGLNDQSLPLVKYHVETSLCPSRASKACNSSAKYRQDKANNGKYWVCDQDSCDTFDMAGECGYCQLLVLPFTNVPTVLPSPVNLTRTVVKEIGKPYYIRVSAENQVGVGPAVSASATLKSEPYLLSPFGTQGQPLRVATDASKGGRYAHVWNRHTNLPDGLRHSERYLSRTIWDSTNVPNKRLTGKVRVAVGGVPSTTTNVSNITVKFYMDGTYEDGVELEFKDAASAVNNTQGDNNAVRTGQCVSDVIINQQDATSIATVEFPTFYSVGGVVKG